MMRTLLMMIWLAAVCGAAQAQQPEGRWDGMVVYGSLQIPFTLQFEPGGKTLTAALVNGDARVSSTEGSFEAGTVRLLFGATGARLEATLKDGQLKGTIGKQSFTASAYCSCAFEGEAGPDLSGTWEAPELAGRLMIRRRGDDTLVTVSRPNGDLGPLTGRFDGFSFSLRYFDGAHAALLELEPSKDGSLSVKLTEPGAPAKTSRAVRATARK